MKKYNENVYLGCMKTNLKKYKGKIARIHDGYYFSMFLKFNNTGYFDLENNKIYSGDEIKIISKVRPREKEVSERRLSKILTYKLKTL